MKKLRIVLLSSALAFGLGQAAHAVYTQNDLVQLRGLVDAGDTQAIIAFINANPQLIEGTDQLAEALRDFVASREGFLGGVFGPRVPNLADVPDLTPDGNIVADSGSLSDFGS